jgi:hypothetical protein
LTGSARAAENSRLIKDLLSQFPRALLWQIAYLLTSASPVSQIRMPTEADTCRKFVVPKLLVAGWDDEPHSIAEQRTITEGRIIPAGKGFIRKPPKRVDYLLRYTRDFPLAVVEAKAGYKSAADGLQQAKVYAEMLGLKFAYATNGPEIIEFDYLTGVERACPDYPTPADLWKRYRNGSGLTSQQVADQLLTPFNHAAGKGERYYQQIAVNRTVEAILKGQKRLLLTMATGTGKSAALGIANTLCVGHLLQQPQHQIFQVGVRKAVNIGRRRHSQNESDSRPLGNRIIIPPRLLPLYVSLIALKSRQCTSGSARSLHGVPRPCPVYPHGRKLVRPTVHP